MTMRTLDDLFLRCVVTALLVLVACRLIAG